MSDKNFVLHQQFRYQNTYIHNVCFAQAVIYCYETKSFAIT